MLIILMHQWTDTLTLNTYIFVAVKDEESGERNLSGLL
jgi:hypothetical protein